MLIGYVFNFCKAINNKYEEACKAYLYTFQSKRIIYKLLFKVIIDLLVVVINIAIFSKRIHISTLNNAHLYKYEINKIYYLASC